MSKLTDVVSYIVKAKMYAERIARSSRSDETKREAEAISALCDALLEAVLEDKE